MSELRHLQVVMKGLILNKEPTPLPMPEEPVSSPSDPLRHLAPKQPSFLWKLQGSFGPVVSGESIMQVFITLHKKEGNLWSHGVVGWKI